jgi:choline dehydrogenase-like flavoprotein
MNRLGAGPDGLATGMLMVALMEVRSEGRVMLASADPAIDPAVDFAMLSDELDLVRLRWGVRHLQQVLAHRAVASLAEAVVIDEAGAPPESLDSDDDVDRWLLAHTGDYVHAAGTCRMGDPADEQAVVDPGGRVIGYEALRVADASVMPDLPRANTHLTAVVIGEVVADRMRSGG